MVDLHHPLVVLAGRLPWERIEQAPAPRFTHQERPVQKQRAADLLGEHALSSVAPWATPSVHACPATPPRSDAFNAHVRGVDADNLGIEIIHRGKFKTLSALQKRWLKHRQAIESLVGHTKFDHRMDRWADMAWLQRTMTDGWRCMSEMLRVAGSGRRTCRAARQPESNFARPTP